MKKDDKSDIHNGIALAIIFSLVSIIMSICSLARNNERVLGFDYLGVIVGILTLLVTALIGWQIYSALNVENRISKAEIELQNMLVEIQETKSSIEKISISSERYSTAVNYMACALTNYYQIRLDKDKREGARAREFCVSYIMAVRSITYFLESEKKNTLIVPWIQSCINILENCLSELSKEQYQSISGYVPKIIEIRCDDAYTAIIKHINIFDEVFIEKVTKFRARRKELLTGKYEDAKP